MVTTYLTTGLTTTNLAITNTSATSFYLFFYFYYVLISYDKEGILQIYKRQFQLDTQKAF